MVRLSRERRKFRFWRRVKLFGALFLFILIASGVVYSLFFSGWFDINQIKVNELNFSDNSSVYNFVQGKLNQKILYFIPKNLLVLNIRELKKEIIENYKSIEKIKIVRDFKHKTLAFLIEEKEPALIWCSHSNCALISKTGQAFKEVDKSILFIASQSTSTINSEETYLRNIQETIIEDKTIFRPIEIGKDITISEIIDFIKTLVAELEKNNFVVSDINMENNTGDISFKINNEWTLLTNKDLKPDYVIQVINSVLAQDLKDKKFEYIDLRIEDKLFYKLAD